MQINSINNNLEIYPIVGTFIHDLSKIRLINFRLQKLPLQLQLQSTVKSYSP